MSLRTTLMKLAQEDPSLRPYLIPLLKKARLRDGPIGRVLDENWNYLHDLEYGLEKAAREYDVAASYDGPGKSDAERIRDRALRIKKALEVLSMKQFAELASLEEKFLRKYGAPDEYAEAQRKQVFPR